MAHSLDSLTIDNRFVTELPGDEDTRNWTRQVYEACYSFVEPKQTAEPQLICGADEVAELIGLDPQEFTNPEFARIFSGNKLLEGMQPYACCYGGHQFGNWAGQLGDGRAINLGEVVTDNKEHFTLQLKGAGPTPYSRSADGLAVLRSSVREFLCSEAMYHLGVPTTRALSLSLTGDQVMRDMFYDGNNAYEPGAVVCRVASSFTRFGSFEIFPYRGDEETLKKLLDYTIKFEFPHLYDNLEKDAKGTYLAWFAEVADKTIDMIVHWMRVGFVHGVMNTDNMSIHGLTIDYGPYGWIDNYDPNWTPNTTDAQGRRYRFSNQPAVAQWNLLQLANAIYPLIQSTPELEKIINDFDTTYMERHLDMLRDKLGLFDAGVDDGDLVNAMHQVMENCELDMTIFFRSLAGLSGEQEYKDEELFAVMADCIYGEDPLSEGQTKALLVWLRSYLDRVRGDSGGAEDRVVKMNSVNPKYVLRNYLAQEAIDKAAEGDYAMVKALLDTMRRPYDEQPEREAFAKKRPDWARHKPGCSMLSCSS